MPELVDLYGRAGFDVLCVTDHVLRTDDPWPSLHGRPCVDERRFGEYTAEIERERARALSAYGLVLVTGLELTYNDPNPDLACHAVALGTTRLVGMDDGPAAAMESANDLGAAVVVAHPHELGHPPPPAAPTRWFARHWRALDGLYHRVELFNGPQLFGWVAEKGLLGVAGGDLHRPEHLPGWTTLIPCEHDPDAVVDYVRSRRPVFLARLELETHSRAA